MAPPPEPYRTAAIEQLESFGLSAYAARTFVALVAIGSGTAQEISNTTDVPRTRVYDAVDELASNGLVDVENANPKRFWAVSRETACQHFEEDFTHRITLLRDAFDAIETRPRREEQRGVWTVEGSETIARRVGEFVDSATDEVVYMSVAPLLTDELLDSLAAAEDRDVTVKLGEMSRPATEAVERRLSEAVFVESLWNWSDVPSGRLLLVDGSRALVSVLPDRDLDAEVDHATEAAIWGSGSQNSLVVVLNALFGWRVDGYGGQ